MTRTYSNRQRGGTYISIHWWSISNYQKTFFQFLQHRTLASSIVNSCSLTNDDRWQCFYCFSIISVQHYFQIIAKTTSKKIGALICFMKFLSSEVALYLYKSTIQSCVKYCCHAWAGAPSCYLELLYNIQKQICRTVGASLAASLQALAHWNVASLWLLSLFYRYYFGRCSSELAEQVPLPYSWGRSTHYSDRLHDFSITIPRRYKDVYVNSFFPCPAILWNSLPIECFPLTYDLNGFMSRINRLITGSF